MIMKAYRVFNMRTQTAMESANVDVDDSYDFSEFSKEDVISSLIEEIGDETATDQLVATPNKIGSSLSEFVATADKPETGTVKPIAIETDQEVDSKKSKGVSTDVLIDPIRKEPSSRVKKNHPLDLIIEDPNKGMVTRKRYVNYVKYVCFVSMCKQKKCERSPS